MPPAAIAARVAMTQDKWPRKCNIFTGWTFPDDLSTPEVTCTSTLPIFTSGEVANYVGKKSCGAQDSDTLLMMASAF